MTERKFVRLWITVLVAILVVSAGNGAWADPGPPGPCKKATNLGKPAEECVNLYGYDVWVNRGIPENPSPFPYYDGSDSVYVWSISSYDAIYNVGHLDIQIPKNIAAYSYLTANPKNIEVSVDGCTNPLPFRSDGTTPPGWFLYVEGKGDPSTGFGSFEFDKYVLKIIPGTSGACAITKSTSSSKNVTVKIKGKYLFSGPDEFMLKAATKGGSAQALPLLGPSLASSASSGNSPPVRSDEEFQLGDTGCKMHVKLNSGGMLASASVDPMFGDANCPGQGPLTIEDIKNTFVCDANNCTANPDGTTFNCTDPPPGINCTGYSGTYYCNSVPSSTITTCAYNSGTWPNTYTCTSSTDLTAYGCTGTSGTYTCTYPLSIPEYCNITTPTAPYCYLNTVPSNSCDYDYTAGVNVCSPSSTPPACANVAGNMFCSPLNCKPKTFVERNIIDKSGDGSTYCYYTTFGQRVCKTL